MKVQTIMSRAAKSCSPDQDLEYAAHMMRDHDIGCLPVVNAQNQPIAMITDRDICMAALSHRRPLSEIRVRNAMSRAVFSCREDDPVSDAERTMRDWQLRRLPVVNQLGVLSGVLSLNDIVLARRGRSLAKTAERLLGDVDDTLAAICRHRTRSHGSAQELHRP